MRILLSWLRDFVDVDVAAPVLAEALVTRGFEVASVDETSGVPLPPWRSGAGGQADAVFDLEITANRPDCLSVFGIAREVATIYSRPLRAPGHEGLALPTLSVGENPALTIDLDDPELCPRYSAAVIDVSNGTSPPWLLARLEACDVRPISAIVDVTNYVMLEIGQPMHAFDLTRLDGPGLRIRRARAGETLKTLDGQPRVLTPDMLVIADATKPQAVAGVMGGARSEVHEGTRTIVLESACFEPRSVRRTSKTLGLKTEASARFERGADVGATILGLQRAAALLEMIKAGAPRGAMVDRYPHPREERRIKLRRARTAALIGLAVPDADVARILTALGFGVETATGGWTVTVPTGRVDVAREADLIEEVARHHGYDRLTPTFPVPSVPAAPPDVRIPRDQLVRRVLTAAGCSEAITFAFIEEKAATLFAAGAEHDLVAVDNPLSAKFAVLRRSLLPGLVDALAHNRRHGRTDVKLFEIGSRFSIERGETRGLSFACGGSTADEHWSGGSHAVDFFDAKGIVERLCEALRVPVAFEASSRDYLVPGRTATIVAQHDRRPLGVLGQIAPAITEARGLPRGDDVYGAELNLDELWYVAESAREADDPTASAADAVRPLPRFPSIVRDLSIVVDDVLPAAAVRGTIGAAAPETLERIREFDRYTGAGVPDGRVSLSFRLTFRASDRTLTDAEVQRAMERILAALVEAHRAVQR